MSEERQVHPMDVSTLEKGSVVSVDAVERIVKCSRASPAFSLKVLWLKSWIVDALNRIGREWTLCCDHGAIRVLTDSEAIAYNFRQHRIGCRKLRRSLRRQVAVNINNLTPEQRIEHEKMMTRQAGIVSSMNRRKLPMLPEPHRRIE
jgi:hypothetical protein